MSGLPPKLDAGKVRADLAEVVKAHGSIRHHAQTHAADSYAELAAKAKAEADKAPKV